MAVFADEKEKDIKFQISLNEEQKEAKSVILANSISYISGGSGAGKTLLACQVALDMYFKRRVKNIIITRPAVEAGEKLGFLPGPKDEKLEPYVQAIYRNFYALYNKAKVDKMIVEGVVQIVPFAYMRGLTFCDSVIIADEIQNVDVSHTKMVMERLGKGSKMMLCGDINQVDLPKSTQSGIKFLDFIHNTNTKNFAKIVLKANHRAEIVQDILLRYEEFKEKN